MDSYGVSGCLHLVRKYCYISSSFYKYSFAVGLVLFSPSNYYVVSLFSYARRSGSSNCTIWYRNYLSTSYDL